MKTETKRPVGRPPNRKIARLMQRHGISRATAYRKASKRALRIQSTRSAEERGLDAYFTPPEAVITIMHLERIWLPKVLCDPCAGDGAFTRLLDQHGYETFANDIADYGLPDCTISDYFAYQIPVGVEGILTNPPFSLAAEFLEKALREVGYVGLLLRSMWYADADSRDDLLEQHPPNRIWNLKRLPMMHREGYTGKKSTSNVPYSLMVWDRTANYIERTRRPRWREIWAAYQAGQLELGPR